MKHYNAAKRYYRENEVLDLLGIARSTLWRWYSSDQFPRPLKFGPSTIRWDADQVETWLAQRAGKVGA